MFEPGLMTGQRILVTGGGTGLGQAMAEQFLRLGADIAICGRRKAVCDETADAWRTTFPERRIDTFGVDIRNAQAIEEMVESLWQSGGVTGQTRVELTPGQFTGQATQGAQQGTRQNPAHQGAQGRHSGQPQRQRQGRAAQQPQLTAGAQRQDRVGREGQQKHDQRELEAQGVEPPRPPWVHGVRCHCALCHCVLRCMHLEESLNRPV